MRFFTARLYAIGMVLLFSLMSYPAFSSGWDVMTDSELAQLLQRFDRDRDYVTDFYHLPLSESNRERRETFYDEWTKKLSAVDFESLNLSGQIDYLLLTNHLRYRDDQFGFQASQDRETLELLPFAQEILRLEESRWEVKPVSPRESAKTLVDIQKRVEQIQKQVKNGLKSESANPDKRQEEDGDTRAVHNEQPENDAVQADDSGSKTDEIVPITTTKVIANRAAGALSRLMRTLEHWFDHYDQYHPTFHWWAHSAYQETNQALKAYRSFLREKVAGYEEGEDPPLIGDPIGEERLLSDLRHEMIPYSPQELIEIANQEFAWCETEMLKASRELGFGEDWKAALDHVKSLHVEPGEQDALMSRQSKAAIQFLEERDLITIPALAREMWRVEMISQERQKVNPYAFYGGQYMGISYPTLDMDPQAKEMSMRGNNIHFSRIVTPHELIPGHHLQKFMASRYNPQRRPFSTPFLVEGWALYWEMLLWDLGYPRGPEDRIGMLFWRMHRCARIIVSLKFHLNQMTPQEMIDFLVERVGHEVDGATSEVRRYIAGNYSPLYQCAYMLGGLQIYAMRKEVVETGQMTNREFHDAILKENEIPIVLIRAKLLEQDLEKNELPKWRFYAGL